VRLVSFTRFADKAGIVEVALCGAVRDAERGLVTVDLGAGIINSELRVLVRASPADSEL